MSDRRNYGAPVGVPAGSGLSASGQVATGGALALGGAALAAGGTAMALYSNSEQFAEAIGYSPTAAAAPTSDNAAARFILHASLGTTAKDIAAVRSLGYEAWLDAEIAAPIEKSAKMFFSEQGYNRINRFEWYNHTSPGDAMIWNQLLTGGNRVRKRIALALSEFFVVSLSKIDLSWRSQAIGYYWDTLNQYAFGSFDTLLKLIALNPAMGYFLNTLDNRKADPTTGRVPDENFGREVMQLFSIGLYQLNMDGTLKLGSNGQPIETYTNADVSGIAKCFTGYDFDMTGVTINDAYNNPSWKIPSANYVQQPLTANPHKWRWYVEGGYHSPEEKSFLGLVIPAGTSAEETLRLTINQLFRHPNVAPFFCKQMIQRLVTSNPSPAYVERVASVFVNNGAGKRGDLKAVFKAILLDEEALSPAGLTDPRFGKLREPILRFVQWGRAFGAESASGKWEIGDLSDRTWGLSQSPLRAPSVFNFFRPGFVPPNSTTAANGLVAPEMQMVNEASVAAYANFVTGIVDGSSWYTRDVKAAYSGFIGNAHDAPALLNSVSKVMTGGQLNDTTKSVILAAMQNQPVTIDSDRPTKLKRVHICVMLVMISNDFLIQR